MKKVISVVVLCFTIIASSFAQPSVNSYKKMDYIKVPDGDMAAFIDFSKKELKSKYQQLLDEGAITSWKLYKTKFPGGDKSGYDFVSIVATNNIDSLQQYFDDIATPRYVPSLNASKKKQKKAWQMSSIVKSEIWQVENFIETDQKEPSRYMSWDYMRVPPDKNPDYLMLEEEIAKPIHSERINQGTMEGWEVHSLLTPGGTQYGYSFATANYFDQIKDLEFGFTTEIINQTMGKNANIPELFDTIYSTRDLVKIELWELMVHTN